jgi:hypothetical protein
MPHHEDDDFAPRPSKPRPVTIHVLLRDNEDGRHFYGVYSTESRAIEAALAFYTSNEERLTLRWSIRTRAGAPLEATGPNESWVIKEALLDDVNND